MSEGERRVNLDFNPSGSDDVYQFKSQAASLIDLINFIGNDDRLTEITKTVIEEAAMWGVKSITSKTDND